MEKVSLQHVNFRENETFLKLFSDGPKRDKGELFLLIDLPDNPGAEDALVEKLWRALHDSFFNCDSDDPYFCFEEALKAVNLVLEQENQKRAAGTIGRFYAIASLLQGSSLHFAQTGHAVVYLKRGQQLSQISEEAEGGAESGFSSISSGDLQLGDCIVFSTRYLPFDQDTLVETFSQKGAKLTHHLKSLAKQKELTGIVASFVVSETGAEEIEAELPLEEEPILAEEAPQEEMTPADLRADRREGALKKKTKKMLESITSRIPRGKLESAKKTFRGVAAGMGSKFSKLVKKPERIKTMNRRYVLVGVIGLVVVLGILITLQSGYREQAQQAQHFEDLLSQVKNNISIAENRFLIGEKVDASEFLNKAATALQEIETGGFYQSDVEKLKKEISLYRDNFDAIVRASNPNVAIDLSQKGTVDALGIVHTQDQKDYIYEPRRIFEALLDTVQEGLAIDPEEVVIAGTELEDFNVLSFLTQSGQLIEYSTRNGNFERSKTQDDVWKKGVDIKSYAGANVYYLDPSANTIWKYQRLRTGYGSASVYSAEGDLSNAVSMTIDGDIFVLLRDGQIIRYRKGAIQPFEIKSQPSIPLNNPSRIFTLAEAKNIYVLDSANRRVVVYSKGTSGISQYMKQVVFEYLKPNEIRDFYIDKDEQKIVILTANKAYIADL